MSDDYGVVSQANLSTRPMAVASEKVIITLTEIYCSRSMLALIEDLGARTCKL